MRSIANSSLRMFHRSPSTPQAKFGSHTIKVWPGSSRKGYVRTYISSFFDSARIFHSFQAMYELIHVFEDMYFLFAVLRIRSLDVIELV